MRWPWMTKKRHEHELQLQWAVMERAADDAFDDAYAEATRKGRAQVHAWARELTANLYLESHPNIFRNKALAAFQQAEAQFAPKQLEAPDAITRA